MDKVPMRTLIKLTVSIWGYQECNCVIMNEIYMQDSIVIMAVCLARFPICSIGD